MGSADYGDTVTVESHITELKSRTVSFGYRVVLGDKLIAMGTTRHVAVDHDQKPHRLPAALIGALEAYVER